MKAAGGTVSTYTKMVAAAATPAMLVPADAKQYSAAEKAQMSQQTAVVGAEEIQDMKERFELWRDTIKLGNQIYIAETSDLILQKAKFIVCDMSSEDSNLETLKYEVLRKQASSMNYKLPRPSCKKASYL